MAFQFSVVINDLTSWYSEISAKHTLPCNIKSFMQTLKKCYTLRQEPGKISDVRIFFHVKGKKEGKEKEGESTQ